jgi:hypothetical protein
MAPVLALALLPAQTARAQAQLVNQVDGDKPRAEPMPVHLWASLTQSVGSGSFVLNPPNPTTSTTLTFTPLIIYKGWMVLANQSIGLEWTDDDNAAVNRAPEVSDLTIAGRSLRHLALPELNLGFWPTLGYQVPLSLGSRQAGSLGTVIGAFRTNYFVRDVGLTLYGTVGGAYSLLVPGLAARFGDNPVRPYEDRQLGTVTPVSCNPRNAAELQSYACNDGALPAQWRWNANIGFWWYYLFDGTLGVTADFGFNQSFSTFVGPDDQFKADNAVAGLVPRQATSGSVSLVWIALDWLWLSGGVSSSQPFLTADGKAPRFPLWDFVSPHNNFSSVFFDATLVL